MGSFQLLNRTVDHNSKFRELADRVCEKASKYSFPLTGYHSPELPIFNRLPLEKRGEALISLETFLRSMDAAEQAGEKFDNEGRSVWHALLTLKLVPPSDLFSKIGSDDVVEIYDLQGVQIWRSFNFLKFCSYTLEEMYSIEWHNRYSRDPGKTEECIRKMQDLMLGKTPEVYFAGISEHLLEESCSSERLVLQASHGWGARLRNQDGELAASCIISKVRLLGKGLPTQKLRPQIMVVHTNPELTL